MRVLEVPQTLPERVNYLLEPVLTRDPASETEKEAWQQMIDQHLAEQARDPQPWADEDIDAPSAGMIRWAINVAKVLRDQGVEAPDRLVPNGDGGIVFRWRSGDLTWTLELDADGSMETSLMHEAKLLCRHSLHGLAIG